MTTPVAYPSPDLLVRQECEVGESPVWIGRTQTIAWVDLLAGTVFTSVCAGAVATELSDVGTSIGAIAALNNGRDGFAVASGHGFGFAIDGRLTIDDADLPSPRFRLNDAKVDSRGRLWAGSTEVDFAESAGNLHVWDGGGPSAVASTGWTLPNGMGWNPSVTRMYVVDSIRGVVFSAEYDADDGLHGEFTELFRVDDGLPDGMAVDADGCLWVAVWGGSAVRRYSPAGQLIGVVETAVSQPSSCAFGEGGVLYITSARRGLAPRARAREPLAGSVFAVDVGVPGLPVHEFAGSPTKTEIGRTDR